MGWCLEMKGCGAQKEFDHLGGDQKLDVIDLVEELLLVDAIEVVAYHISIVDLLDKYGQGFLG